MTSSDGFLRAPVDLRHQQSLAILKQAFHAVETFRPLSEAEVRALLAKTTRAGAAGRFEPFKTTSIFDATAQNPSWLGEEPPHVRALMPAQ